MSRVELKGEALTAGELRVEFAGEWYSLQPGQVFIIGREGDLRVDDNPYLHRNFLRLAHASGLWWLVNDGSRLAATVSDVDERAVESE